MTDEYIPEWLTLLREAILESRKKRIQEVYENGTGKDRLG